MVDIFPLLYIYINTSILHAIYKLANPNNYNSDFYICIFDIYLSKLCIHKWNVSLFNVNSLHTSLIQSYNIDLINGVILV